MEAGDQVDVQVRHSLARCRTIVDSDVESIWTKFRLCRSFRLIQQFEQRSPLRRRDLEEGADMTLGNHQAMAR
ncbi:hypothetical protein ASC92_26600 [Variovorax sp. Root411]|nr:hypothetical protein ASC92_26600 [Variovorax sp. Root411]